MPTFQMVNIFFSSQFRYVDKNHLLEEKGLIDNLRMDSCGENILFLVSIKGLVIETLMLCISTSERVPFACQNQFFDSKTTFLRTFKS